MKKKFLSDISANTLQAVINQLCGLVIFYILSVSLNKDQFGEINWSLAVLLTSFGILTCGIDQVALKKIASGEAVQSVLSSFILHVLLAGITFYMMLLLVYRFFPGFRRHHLLLLLGVAKLMIFFSSPFKQLATGLEKFRSLLFMGICSNVVRSAALLLLAFFGKTDLSTIVIIFIAGDLLELLLCVFVVKKIIRIPVKLQWNKKNYVHLFKESLPQLGVSIITAVLARFDWIFLGVLASNMVLADYSFAYKVFEMSTLPLLVVAPVLITRFTRLFHPAAGSLTNEKTTDLFVLLKMEVLIACITAMALTILWVPMIDVLTHGKYGAVNKYTILILSGCLPFLYLNNFLWTINFARGRLKMIFYVFLITLVVNLTADIFLIPRYRAEGAAVGYLSAIIAQSLLYLSTTKLEGLNKNIYRIILFPCFAAACAFVAERLFSNTALAVIIAIPGYLTLLIISRQLVYQDWRILIRVTGFQRAT